ncbi:hypothetical protein SLS62_001122 [Diatrype stigma]|uniref:Ergosterol biosynthetic protein 28 n=1 Tax=Diatrype stigma TaxID=117547 RepID=A0AAN9YTP4_9PEZI
MDFLTSLLPPAKGYLPYYMFTLSVIAVGNSLQNYVTLHYTRRVYNGQFVPNPQNSSNSDSKLDPDDSTTKLVPAFNNNNNKEGRAQDQVTPLAARLFGTYTLISAIVRLYASYHLRLAPVYQMAVWTYVVALLHFLSEFLVYKTARFGTPIAMPFFFASVGIFWMVSQYGFYVEA